MFVVVCTKVPFALLSSSFIPALRNSWMILIIIDHCRKKRDRPAACSLLNCSFPSCHILWLIKLTLWILRIKVILPRIQRKILVIISSLMDYCVFGHFGGRLKRDGRTSRALLISRERRMVQFVVVSLCCMLENDGREWMKSFKGRHDKRKWGQTDWIWFDAMCVPSSLISMIIISCDDITRIWSAWFEPPSPSSWSCLD